MFFRTMFLQFRILSEPGVTDETVHDRFPNVMDIPLMVPFLLQTFEVFLTNPAFEFTGAFLRMCAFNVLIQHGFEMEDFLAVLALNGHMVLMVFHMLSDHFLRVKLPLTHIALEEVG